MLTQKIGELIEDRGNGKNRGEDKIQKEATENFSCIG
jgi:hypothetical protein